MHFFTKYFCYLVVCLPGTAINSAHRAFMQKELHAVAQIKVELPK